MNYFYDNLFVCCLVFFYSYIFTAIPININILFIFYFCSFSKWFWISFVNRILFLFIDRCWPQILMWPWIIFEDLLDRFFKWSYLCQISKNCIRLLHNDDLSLIFVWICQNAKPIGMIFKNHLQIEQTIYG